MSEEGWEQKYVKEAFDTNWVVPMGPNVNAFEQNLSDFANANSDGSKLDRTVVCLSAGTAAVHLALIGCGVQPGDEVLVQSFTFCASSHPITYLGAKPVFVGSEGETWNMDPVLLEQAIQNRIAKTGKTPKAIVPVVLYGMPYRIDEILAIADKYGIPVVEDAAEGLGSRFNDQVLGTFGKYGVLSFNGNKMITTSGGGALICRSKEDANEVMWYATQARDAYPYYQHTAIGYNYRMSNVCAGIGRGQMTVLDAHIAHHQHVQSLYEELLKDVPGVHLHGQPADPRYDANFWLCAATLDPEFADPGTGERLQGGHPGRGGRCRRRDPCRGQRDDRLPAERERGSLARVHAGEEGGMPSGMEADAQAASVRRSSRLYQQCGGRIVQGGLLFARQFVCHGRRCALHRGLHPRGHRAIGSRGSGGVDFRNFFFYSFRFIS